MDDIMYVEEPVKEEIFSGNLILDGHMTSEEMREKIIQMMELAGVKVENKDSLEIGFDGVEDDNGISETQTSPFHVFQTVMKKVPYRVTREEVFSGRIILDGHMTAEEQREKIFDMMRIAGVSVEDPDTLEIGYEGVEDDNGISDAQTSLFVVFRVHKEKLSSTKEVSNKNKEALELALSQIKDLRNKLGAVMDSEERRKLIEELQLRVGELEERVGKDEKDLSKDFHQVDDQIESLQKSLKKAAKEYEDSLHRMENILKEQTNSFENGNLSSEELDNLRNEFAHRKMEENEMSAQIRRDIEEQKKLLTNLKRRKNKIEKEVDKADELGVSVSDLKEISNALQKTSVMNAILNQKGLESVVDKKATERTAEEKSELKKAKEEVVKEISEAKKEKKESSILDLIEALYSVQVQYIQGKPPRVLIVKESQLEEIKKNVDKVPERIVGDARVYDYHPEEIPVDLQDVDMQHHREEVFSGTYILDGVRMSEAEQRKKIFDMMRIAGVPVEDESDYEIGYEGVQDDNGISETQSTKFVVYRKIKEENKEIENETEADNGLEEKVSEIESRGFDERIVFFSDVNNGNIYVRDYVIRRFNLIPTGGEVRIEESLCYPIEAEDALYIVKNQNNNYSPYFVETREIALPKEEVVEDIPEAVLDEIEMYHDVDNNDEKYVKQDTIVRFNLIPQSDATEIEKESYYRINEDDANFVLNNQDNTYSPYRVQYREAHLGKREVVEDRVRSEERKELVEKITIYRDLDNNNEVYVKKYVVERFNFVPVSDQVRIDGAVCYRIENEDAGYLITNANNRYSPYEVDVQDIELGKRVVVDDLITKLDRKDLVEKIVLYRDLDHNGDIYAKKYVNTRFNTVPTGPEVRIMKAACHKIDPEDVEFIINNANNSYSPYQVEIVDVNLGKETDQKREVVNTEGLVEKMILYRDVDQSNQIYAKKYTCVRFNIEPVGASVRIDGMLCYPISEEDAMFVVSNQSNGYSPYEVDIKNIHLHEVVEEKAFVEVVPKEEVQNSVEVGSVGEEKTPEVDEEKKQDARRTVIISDPHTQTIVEPDGKRTVIISSPEEEKVEKIEEKPEEKKRVIIIPAEDQHDYDPEIVLYRNPENINELYAVKSTLTRFAIFPSGDPMEIDGETYYPIRDEDEKKIRNFISQAMDSHIVVSYRYLPLVPKENKEDAGEVTFESIMQKLMIPSNQVGATRYTASNIRPSRKFSEELRDGDWVYNIVHFLSSKRIMSSEFLQKLSEKLLGSREGKDSMNAFQNRVDSLSNKELDILLKRYHDTHSIHQANQIVVERIHEYLRKRIDEYNRNIMNEYESIYTLLGQIRVIEETLKNTDLSERAINCFNRERENKLSILAEVAKKVVKEREEIQTLLGDSLGNLSELQQFAFAMMPYKNLSRESQNRFKEYKNGFDDAVLKGQTEEIVSDFMGMESCYYDNSDVAVRMVDTNEIGMKYFAPVVTEFNFRDDTFGRDLFRIVTASSVVVHDIESKQKNRISSIDNPSECYVVKEDFDISSVKRENLSSPEVDAALNKVLLDYGNGVIDQDNAIYQLERITRKNHSLLVSVINEIINALKPYAERHTEFDYEKVQAALEYVLSHPEAVASNQKEYKDVIGECLYGIPKELLSCLISSAAAVTLASDVSDTMKKKYHVNELSEMMKESLTEEEHGYQR